MKFAVIIITHTAPEQTQRLVGRLNTGDFDCYIHVDKKVDIETHRDMFGMEHMYFVEERFDVQWGGYSAIEATLSCIRKMVASGIKYDHVSLLSGQDYPIKNAEHISRFFAAHPGKQFMLYKNMETEWQIAKARVEKYHFTDFNFRGKHRLEDVVNFLTPKRKFPIDMELFGKETYWSITGECAAYVANFIGRRPKLQHYLKYTWGADEFLFHSIILNSPFKDTVVNKNYRYMVWPPGEPRPKVLTTADLPDLLASDALFARKFDMAVDGGVLDLIDAHT